MIKLTETAVPQWTWTDEARDAADAAVAAARHELTVMHDANMGVGPEPDWFIAAAVLDVLALHATRHLAAEVEAAEQRGAGQVLREAADEMERSPKWIPVTPSDLRHRADQIDRAAASDTVSP